MTGGVAVPRYLNDAPEVEGSRGRLAFGSARLARDEDQKVLPGEEVEALVEREAGGVEPGLDGAGREPDRAGTAGGVNAEQSGVVILTNGTFYKNKAKELSGGVQNEENGATVQLTNVILDSNKKGGCEGLITSNGGNLETGVTCGFGAGDQSDVDKAGLEKLADNGDATPIHALALGSPAIDMGVQKECPAEDQRATARDDGACDVGAFEL